MDSFGGMQSGGHAKPMHALLDLSLVRLTPRVWEAATSSMLPAHMPS